MFIFVYPLIKKEITNYDLNKILNIKLLEKITKNKKYGRSGYHD